MEGDLTKKWHWEEAYQTVELDGGGSNKKWYWEEAYQTVELDGGGSNLEVVLGGGLPNSGTRWRGI